MFTRRQFAFGLGGLVATTAGARLLVPHLLSRHPNLRLSKKAKKFVERCFEGLDRTKIWDTHAHVLGLGSGNTGCEINPNMINVLNPIKRLQYDVYTQVGGIDEASSADQDYLKKLLSLHRAANPKGKLILFAFDRFVDEEGTEQPDLTPFYVPNAYVHEITQANADTRFCASIHPYRKDALVRLDRAVKNGAVAIKWLPNAMGIDPASARCDAFYEALVHHRLPLITHAGNEQAVDSRHLDGLGNPLRLRRPLEKGVRVVIAHLASFGDDIDMESASKEQRPSFELAMRLFDEEAYEENLYADISAITFLNREADTIRSIISRSDIHHRLVNGSDYPLPGIDILVSTRWLAYHDLIDPNDQSVLNEVYETNPLLFDFVVKRSLRVITPDKNQIRLSNKIFESARLFKRAEA